MQRTISPMDQFWQQVIDYIKSKPSTSGRYLVPDALLCAIESGVSYSELSGRAPGDITGAVIHKGMYKEIEASFLNVLLRFMKPTFANAVFIVMEVTGAALLASDVHLGAMSEMKNWAAANFNPGTTQSALAKSSDEALTLMVNFIVQNLAKTIDTTQTEPVIAIAETSAPFNDTAWFWVDDTAKTAELLAVPRVRDANPALADATLDFVLRLSPDHIIQRRAAVPQLKLVDSNPESFRAHNSFFRLTGNLTRGVVIPWIRYNDNRTRPVAEYSGNLIEFVYGLRRQTFDIEDTIKRWSIVEHPDRIVFSHTSVIRGKALFGGTAHVCDVTYDYTLWCARPTVEASVSVVVAAGVTLRDVQVTTAFDQMSKGGAFDSVITGCDNVFQTHPVPKVARAVLPSGKADYVGLFESSITPGFAIGLHTHLKNGSKLNDINAQGNSRGHFHWVYARYGLGTLHAGETQRIVENRLLTGGGYYSKPAIYRQLTSAVESGTGDIDPSMSYDIGAELNAVACTILFARRGRYAISPPVEERIQTLKRWFDRHLDIYFEVARPGDPDERHRVFVRGLSFVILALDCMARTFGDDYRSKLESCVQLLLRLEVPVARGDGWTLFATQAAEDSNPPELDCQCAALLALARAATWGDPDRRISDAIRRGLHAILIVSTSGEAYGQPGLIYDTISVRKNASGGPEDTGYWNFKLGLALRAFHTIRQVNELGYLALEPQTLTHLELLTERAQNTLQSSMRMGEATLEALTSQLSNETNSETQPWVALGLAPAIEWEILGKPKDVATIQIPRERPVTPAARTYFDKASPPNHVEWECSASQAVRLLGRVSATWELLGQTRPHWSVLTEDQFLPAHISKTERAFFSTGKHDCNRLLATIRRAGRDPSEFKVVHEFGCGLGRMTNWLSESFERVVACDVSSAHLNQARSRSSELARNNIVYRRSALPEFAMFEQFDLWFTLFVLQHNPPPIIAMILRQAFKQLRPGGLAVFHIPTYALHYEFKIEEYLLSEVPQSGIEMHFLPQQVVFKLINEAGCSLVEVVEQDVGHPHWLTNSVVVTK